MANSEMAADWLQRLRQGDPDAVTQLHHYIKRLVCLARQRLPGKLVGRLSAEDVVQSVLGSLVRYCNERSFLLHADDDLWCLLAQAIERKIREHYRNHTRGKRSVDAEANGDPSIWLAEQHNGVPGPEEEASIREQIEYVRASLPERHRPIFDMYLAGYNYKEIAAELGYSRQNVSRVVKEIIRRLKELLQPEE